MKNNYFRSRNVMAVAIFLSAYIANTALAQPAAPRLHQQQAHEQHQPELEQTRKHPAPPQKAKLRDTADVVRYLPDTVYAYCTNGTVTRYCYSYQNGNRISELINGSNWVNFIKNTYTYNAKNNMTQYLYQVWDVNTQQLIKSMKRTYVYNAQNNITQNLTQFWDNNTQQWKNSYRYVSSYDAQNNRTEYLYQEYSDMQWVSNYKYTYAYDAQNNMTEFLYQNGYGDYLTKCTCTYDAQSNRTEELYQEWFGTWMNYSKENWIYDAQGNKTEELYQKWNGSTQQWENNWRFTYAYDTQNNMTEQCSQNWEGLYLYDGKKKWTYDSQNNLIEYLTQNGNDTQWTNSKKYTYTYDVQNNRTEELYQQWFHNYNQWINNSKITYTYDTNNNATTAVSTQKWNNDWVYHNTFSLFLYCNNMQNRFYFDGYYGYYYLTATYTDPSGDNSKPTVEAASPLKVYPNPASSTLNVKLEKAVANGTLTLFDMNGRMVLSQPFNGNSEQINMSQLSAGNYILRLVENGKAIAKMKIVKR